jgi:ferritin-like metal-binding protein YciE
MPRKTLKDVFIHLLSDTYSAEKQLVRALPRMARAATDPALATVFTSHLDETRAQVERIDRVVESCEVKLKRMKCVAMEGLVEEAQEVIDEIDKGPVLDVALIAAAQKVEHYEIASYGNLAELAKQLRFLEGQLILAQTLQEEIDADRKLTRLARGGVNEEALSAPEPVAA